jgi:chemotaxis response regulator CheB
VRRIKVLIANQPRLMRDLVVATVSEQPDIEVVDIVEDEAMILESAEQKHPDFLIIGLDRSDARPPLCDVLLDRFPHLCILALAADRNSTIFYWASLNIRANRIEHSEEGILNALRGRKLIASAPGEVNDNSRVN